MSAYAFLTDEQVDSFLTRGFVLVKDALRHDVREDWASRVWTRLDYDANDPTTWVEARVHMPALQHKDVSELAPKAWSAICDLCGGKNKVRLPCRWGDSFIVNLGTAQDAETWQPPSPRVSGWHKDGDWFRHFLDSPEQGLLTVALWSDVLPGGGATFVAGDSVGPVARFLVEHPEGVTPGGFDFAAMSRQCSDFFEATGDAGDVYLLHPYLLHASSQNKLRRPRLMTNPAVSLSEPMQFRRANGEYSLIEQAILRGLGVSHLDFAPAAPRERIVPRREALQKKMREEEQARLAASTAA